MSGRSGRLGRLAVIAIVIAALLAGSVWGYRRLTAGRSAVRYITRPVAYADIAASVSETGTVNPVNPPGVVQIGSQVSGTIDSIKVDYNSKVTKGEVLATLDPTMFQATVDQDRANVLAAQATAAAAQNTVQQQQSAVATAQATLQQDEANLRAAQASQRQAVANYHAAEANVRKAQSTVALANLTVGRDRSLLQQGFIPQNQMDTDATALATDTEDLHAAQESAAAAAAAVQTSTAQVNAAQAQVNAAASQLRTAQAQVQTALAQALAAQHQVQSSAAQLRQAEYNLSRTVITSPIDGIVLGRNISVGQTVAASFQTPTLFTLATNLTDMQVDTSVDEADVGPVRAGQKAQITVTAFPNVTFNGVVHEVQLNPTTVSNVVTYDAVVLVHDAEARLRPGMTAQVSINVTTRSHVLAIPIQALLYRPIAPGQAGGAQGAGGPGGGAPGGGGPPAGGPGGGPASAPVAGAPGSQVTVWTLRGGRPAAVRIVIGFSDGQNVEVRGGALHEGDRVIIAQVRGQGRRPPGGGAGGLGGGGPQGGGR
jgi:HlyD family secretion protein